MQIKVHITVKPEPGESEEISHEVTCLERGPLRPDTLGLSLAEARAILAGLEQTIAQHQAAEFIAQARRCPRCGRPRACKGHHRIVFRTPFGKLELDNPQLYRCPCESQGPKSVSPLADRMPERTSPELVYLETKFAALVSYGLTLKLLEEVLPIGQDLSSRTIRRQVHQAAERLEAELTQGAVPLLEALPPGENAPSTPVTPLIIGLDGCYVHAAGQRSRTAGWFEVIVGKSLATEDRTAKCFGFVSRYDPEPKRRLSAWLEGLGLQEDQPVTFLSDGGDTVRDLPVGLHPHSEHLLDWFHTTMRLTEMTRLAKGVREADQPELSADLEEMLEHLKGNLWHGKVDRALEITDELAYALEVENGSPEHRKLLKAVRAFEAYVTNHRAFIPNYGERYRQKETISTGFTESAVNQVVSKRFVKKQQMRWTEAGAHLLLQIRVQVLNGDWRATLSRWYPAMDVAPERKAA
ncbi:MAG: ISKra4 family transposase [Verrucomicrobia bacterium]|nr:ISKra4 family transposase [Verrucomicrobiota bacterium]